MLLEVQGLTKRFGGVIALDQITLAVSEGEVVALVGDNGAGKSTFMRCIAGTEVAESGSLRFDSKPLPPGNSHAARSAGIEMIYQNLNLCPLHTGVENIFLGCELTKKIFGVNTPILDRKRMSREARRIIGELNAEIDLARSVGWLSGGQQQAIAIARALLVKPRLLIMDEPTAALGPKEASRVLELIRSLKRAGISVILITHRLAELYDVAGRVVLMRHGAIAADRSSESFPLAELTRAMVA